MKILQKGPRSRGATISAGSLPPLSHSAQPNDEEGTEPSPEPICSHQPRHTRRSSGRRATISGSAFVPAFSAFVLNTVVKLKSIPERIQKLGLTPQSKPSKKVRKAVPDSHALPSNKTRAVESSAKSELERLPNSPTQSHASGDGRTSWKSVQISETKEMVCPKQLQDTLGSESYKSSPNRLPKPALKRRPPPGTDDAPLPQENALTREAQVALDHTICELVTCVKEFKCPLELDFSASTEDALVLKKNEKNEPFINQLRRLDGLRVRLAEIRTHGNEQLEDKHRLTGMAIERALERMKEHQLKLRKISQEQTTRAAFNGR